MYSIIVFTQNTKLDSIKKSLANMVLSNKLVFVSTHYLFENERKYLNSVFGDCAFKTFADFLSDSEMEACDLEAYSSKRIEYTKYIKNIKRLKNNIVADKVINLYQAKQRLIFSDDLGVDCKVWIRHGFKKVEGDYYYVNDKTRTNPLKKVVVTVMRNRLVKTIYHNLFRKRKKNLYKFDEVHVAFFEQRKYVFIGKMDRIAYRFQVPFFTSQDDFNRLNQGLYEPKESCTYLTTWHERFKCRVPDEKQYDVRWSQDGYLPPNYSHKDYFFKPNNVIYYCWDKLGTLLFKNQGLPYELIPFRKKLLLPTPVFAKEIRTVLVVASGSGDWTALKNRSDDDLLVDAFVKIAKQFPSINFIYRCHPTWVHPLNVGVNSIERVRQYFSDSGLKNITLSGNVPNAKTDAGFAFSFSRSSLEEDLLKADIVFGEHSISMIDAAFKEIPFCSVNLTKRRNFYIAINDLGFPSCSTIRDIAFIIKHFSDETFVNNYLKAVSNYNNMTLLDK